MIGTLQFDSGDLIDDITEKPKNQLRVILNHRLPKRNMRVCMAKLEFET